jgi:hypothetical protein
MPITLTLRSKAWPSFIRLNPGVVGSNPTRGMDICVRLFCVQVEALRRADPPSKESYWLCIGLRNQGPTKGCTAIYEGTKVAHNWKHRSGDIRWNFKYIIWSTHSTDYEQLYILRCDVKLNVSMERSASIFRVPPAGMGFAYKRNTAKMDTSISFETSLNLYRNTRRHMPECLFNPPLLVNRRQNAINVAWVCCCCN